MFQSNVLFPSSGYKVLLLTGVQCGSSNALGRLMQNKHVPEIEVVSEIFQRDVILQVETEEMFVTVLRLRLT
jgi:hypothetical protein